MSHPTDLLPYGEQFAEQGLVVRQLDDGSLTLTEDDSLPDEGRVRLTAVPAGLTARLALCPCASPSGELSSALEQKNQASGRIRFAWFDGSVWCESTMPWTGDYAFPSPSLRALYQSVADAAAQQREELSALAGGEGSGGQGSGGEGAVVGGPVALPPSFLPGAGQTYGEGATQRYGAVREVPGRAELGAHDADQTHSRPSGRYARPTVEPEGGGGGGGAVMGVVVLGLVLVLCGVGYTVLKKLDEPPPAPSPSVAKAPSPTSGGPSPAASDAPWPDPIRPPVGGEPPPRSTPEAPRDPDDPLGVYALAASASEGERLLAVKRWKDNGLDAKPKSRLRLLQALKGRIDREAGLILTKSFRDHPVGTYEALDCLEHANPAIKRVLIDQLSRRELNGEERTVVVEMLAEQGEADDPLIDEAMLRLGRPRKGGFQRLLDARGVEWLQLGDGRALLGKLPIAELSALVAHPQPEVRVLVVDLLGDRTGEVEPALEGIAKALHDGDANVRRRAIEATGNLKHGRGAWYLAQALAREEDKRAQELIRNALGRLPVKSSIGYLKSMIAKNQKPETRLAGVMALRAIPNLESVALIVEAVGADDDRKVRIECLEGLVGLLGSSELLPAIRKGVLAYRKLAVDKSDAEVRRLAQRLCLKIDGRIPK